MATLDFTGFVVTPFCILTSDDLELGNSDEREAAVFVFLVMGYLPHIIVLIEFFTYQFNLPYRSTALLCIMSFMGMFLHSFETRQNRKYCAKRRNISARLENC